MKILLAIVLVLAAAKVSSAQIIYQPVQYQYGGQSAFYYGGSDPAFFALGLGRGEQAWGHVNGFAFYSSTVEHFRQVNGEPLRAFSDAIPYENAAVYGYTANDARMAAYKNVARYFRKGDLIAAGVVQADGSVVVAAQAQPIASVMHSATTRPTAVPILIIPRGGLLPAPQSNNVMIVKNQVVLRVGD